MPKLATIINLFIIETQKIVVTATKIIFAVVFTPYVTFFT
jgi:hypothetical protein